MSRESESKGTVQTPRCRCSKSVEVKSPASSDWVAPISCCPACMPLPRVAYVAWAVMYALPQSQGEDDEFTAGWLTDAALHNSCRETFRAWRSEIARWNRAWPDDGCLPRHSLCSARSFCAKFPYSSFSNKSRRASTSKPGHSGAGRECIFKCQNLE